MGKKPRHDKDTVKENNIYYQYFLCYFCQDCKCVSEEIQLRVVRQFGLPDEMAGEVFGQAPDLVESGGSSYSSKQNTLSRVKMKFVKTLLLISFS